jgi:hypothetical protein
MENTQQGAAQEALAGPQETFTNQGVFQMLYDTNVLMFKGADFH